MSTRLFAQHVVQRLQRLRARSAGGPCEAWADLAYDEVVDEIVLMLPDDEAPEGRPGSVTVPCVCETPWDHSRDCPARAALAILGSVAAGSVGTGSVTDPGP